QVDIIEPHRESLGRHLQMRPTLPFQEDSLSFDVKTLDFLLLPETVQVILDLILEEARYREAMKTINARSLHHFDIVQPKLETAGIVEGGEYSDKDFLSALGEHDYCHLQRLSDAVVSHVDRTVESLVSMKERLRAALTGKYPNGKFVNFELLENPPKSIFP
ncbi:MAG: hypothetical protein WCE43_02460, partial [Burkholderiales bacterium]